MACSHYKIDLTEDHRHYMKDDKYNDCLLCLVEAVGPMTQEQVAKRLGVSKMRVSQIEQGAVKRLKKILYKQNNFTNIY